MPRETYQALMTVAQVAGLLQVSNQTVLNKIHSGEWECTKLASRIYRFTPEQYEDIAAGITDRPRPNRKAKMHAALKNIAI